MMVSADDTELVAGITSGNYDSFTLLYEKYIKGLAHYGLKVTDDINTVQDCLHDIFVSLWIRRQELHDYHFKLSTSPEEHFISNEESRKTFEAVQKLLLLLTRQVGFM